RGAAPRPAAAAALPAGGRLGVGRRGAGGGGRLAGGPGGGRRAPAARRGVRPGGGRAGPAGGMTPETPEGAPPARGRARVLRAGSDQAELAHRLALLDQLLDRGVDAPAGEVGRAS